MGPNMQLEDEQSCRFHAPCAGEPTLLETLHVLATKSSDIMRCDGGFTGTLCGKHSAENTISTSSTWHLKLTQHYMLILSRGFF